MNSINRALAGLTLTLALAVGPGCMEEIALVGRPMLQLDQVEIFAEIERVVPRLGIFICDWTTAATGWSVIALTPACFTRVENTRSPNWRAEIRSPCSCVRTLAATPIPTSCVSTKVSAIGIRVRAASPLVQDPESKPSMGEWRRWTSSADPSKYAMSPASGSSFLFRLTHRDQMWIVSGRFGMAITSESRGDIWIDNVLSCLRSFATIDKEFATRPA